MNRVSLRIGLIASVAALSALLFSTVGVAGATQPFGKDGVIHACVKAKGKNKGALRVVPGARKCRRLRGWRPLRWSANASGQAGSQGARGSEGQAGAQGATGSDGSQSPASQVEQSLIETVKTQTTEINGLVKQVADLSDEVLNLEGDVGTLSSGLGSLEGDVDTLDGSLQGLEGTVGETCDQLTDVTKQSDEILDSLLGSTVAVLGNLLNVPSPPDPLGTFECA